MNNNRTVGGWIKFHCGDRVVNVRDPRHNGVVASIIHGVIRVKWDESGWLSEHHDHRDLRLLESRYVDNDLEWLK